MSSSAGGNGVIAVSSADFSHVKECRVGEVEDVVVRIADDSDALSVNQPNAVGTGTETVQYKILDWIQFDDLVTAATARQRSNGQKWNLAAVERRSLGNLGDEMFYLSLRCNHEPACCPFTGPFKFFGHLQKPEAIRLPLTGNAESPSLSDRRLVLTVSAVPLLAVAEPAVAGVCAEGTIR